jgi:hypothetical protein
MKEGRKEEIQEENQKERFSGPLLLRQYWCFDLNVASGVILMTGNYKHEYQVSSSTRTFIGNITKIGQKLQFSTRNKHTHTRTDVMIIFFF